MSKRNPFYSLGYRWEVIVEGSGSVRGAAQDKREADEIADKLNRQWAERLAKQQA
jgi:hypothetical protein